MKPPLGGSSRLRCSSHCGRFIRSVNLFPAPPCPPQLSSPGPGPTCQAARKSRSSSGVRRRWSPQRSAASRGRRSAAAASKQPQYPRNIPVTSQRGLWGRLRPPRWVQGGALCGSLPPRWMEEIIFYILWWFFSPAGFCYLPVLWRNVLYDTYHDIK